MERDFKIQLTAVIPIRSMAGRLDNLSLTLQLCAKLPIQIVIVHDDAQDGTEEDIMQVLEVLGNENIEKYNVQYSSPGLARNLGMKHAKAEWICFWDCDDLPDPSAYLLLLSSINSENFDVLIGAIATQSGSDMSTRKTHQILTSRETLEMQLANMPAFTRMIFRRSFIGNHVFLAFKIGEDQCFLREIEFLNSRVYYSDDLVYVYISDFYGQLSRNPKLTSESVLALEFLASAIEGAPPKMRVFCQTQFLKLLISSSRNEGWIRTFLMAPQAFRATMKLIVKNPRKTVRILFFLARNRAKLAGRP